MSSKKPSNPPGVQTTGTPAKGTARQKTTSKATAGRSAAAAATVAPKRSAPAGRTGVAHNRAATARTSLLSKSAARDTQPTRTTRKNTAAPRVTPEQRRHYIEVAAYYIAERRGFRYGNPAEDWARAEEEIDRLLDEGLLNTGP
ncbi:MAG TPA: DUF2934 domain-containing protein [Thiobacillaceae bacterium]|nr:DUF2934 domain-containing protein [Thiobacillaceae bacterium]HNU65055.1 DUF2934 domain-containing protein [Thiobacillaceae bacterium]